MPWLMILRKGFIYIPLPMFFGIILWILLLPVAVLVYIGAALLKSAGISIKSFVIPFYFLLPKIYFSLKGLKISVRSKSETMEIKII